MAMPTTNKQLAATNWQLATATKQLPIATDCWRFVAGQLLLLPHNCRATSTRQNVVVKANIRIFCDLNALALLLLWHSTKWLGVYI